MTYASRWGMALEPRIMFDGAAVAAAADAHSDGAVSQGAPEAPAREASAAQASAAPPDRKEVAFVDASVPDYLTLVESVAPGIEVVVIEDGQSGLDRMAQWADTHSGYDAIHVLSHGDDATLALGHDTLTAASLSEAGAQAGLAALGKALAADGDLLLYGCSVASDQAGQAFVAALAVATGADVAASDDLTGAAPSGGDWDLEVRSGTVETASLAATSYDGALSLAGTSVTMVGSYYQTVVNPGTGLNEDVLVNYSETAVTGAGIEIDIAGSGHTIDVDTTANTITITMATDDGWGFINDRFDLVFTGGGVAADNITSITRTGGTSPDAALYGGFVSATPNKTVTITVPVIGVRAGTTIYTYTTGPALSSTSPADNATGVLPTANIVMNFNEVPVKNSGNIVIKRTSDNATIETIAVTSGQVTVSGNQVTVNPSVTLADTTEYYVLMDTTAFRDGVGNNCAGISSSTALNFTTADTTAPSLSSSTPADNATALSPTADLVLNFSETVVKGTGNILIKRTSDNSVVETIDVTSGQVTVSGTQVTVNPSVTLADTTEYYVQIAGTAFKDTSNNAYAGITSTTALSFTTADTTGPILSSSTPADNGIEVTFSADVVLNFNETVVKGTGNIVIKKVSDNSVVETIDVTSGQVTVSGTQVTINPSVTFADWTDYYVQVAGTAFKDTSNNFYAGITSTTALNFKTLDSTIPTTPSGTLSIVENAANSSAVGTVSSVGAATYALTDNAGGRFAIDAATGAVTVANGTLLDYESATSHNITVQATNVLGNSRSATIAVSVGDIANEHAPVITSNGGGATASVTVAENTNAVTTVTSTDGDAGATKTYSKVGGADADRFAIDDSTGVLTINARDFEAPTDEGDTAGNNTYVVQVKVWDGSREDTQTITVTIADVDENPVLTSANSVSIMKGGSVTLDVNANNGDGGANDAGVTYAFVGDTLGLTLNTATGVLTGGSGLGVGSHTVVVRANDGGLTTDQTITITVTAPNENNNPGPGSGGTPSGGNNETGNTGNTGGDTGAALMTIVRSQTTSEIGGTTTITVPTLTRIGDDPAPRTFQVAVAARSPGGGDALVINAPLPDAVVTEGDRIAVTIPAEAFAHTQADAAVTLTATRADGAALPGWIQFDPRTGTFEGTPPPGFKGVVAIKVIARDDQGREVVQTFKIVVGQGESQGGLDTADRHASITLVGKPGLTAQLRSISQEGRIAKQAALFNALNRTNKVA